MEKKKIEKPFLKWVGGKIKFKLCLEYFPAEIDTYYEPFWRRECSIWSISHKKTIN